MLTIDVDFEEEINKNYKLTLLADRINNKKRTENTPDCKYNKNKGEIIGKGQFGTIYEFVEIKKQRIDKENETENKRKLKNNERKKKYIIKDSNTYAKVNRIKRKEDLIDQQLKLLDYHDNEITNIKNYTKITQMYYPNNFVKCFDTDHGALYDRNRHRGNSDDIYDDDDFLINQIVLERVFGETLCKYDNLNDMDDLELIFIQIVFIIINMNIIGAFHNDIKSTNIMIEKTNIREKELSLIKEIEKMLETDIKMNLKSNKSYFPIVKFVDYSFSYVITTNEKTEEELKQINKEKEEIKYFLPIEIFHVINMFNKTQFATTEKFNKLKKFCNKLFGNKILNFDLPRITKDNINNYEEVDPTLEEDANKLKLEKKLIPVIKEYFEYLIMEE